IFGSDTITQMQISWRRVAVGVVFIGVAVALGMWALNRPPASAPTIARAVPDAGATPPVSGPASSVATNTATAGSSSTPTYSVATRQIQVAGFGRVAVSVPEGATSHAAVYISGEGAITAAETARIEHLASRGVLVMVLPFDAMRRAEGTVRCWFP